MSKIIECDVCIIGGGLSSAVLAQKLAALKPATVIVVEAGRTMSGLEDRFKHQQRMLDYGENPWPGDVIADQSATGIISRTMAVGGQALHWGGVTPRFSREDFRLKSMYGLADDWPISFEDLEPFYCEAERVMGVAGEQGAEEDPRSEPYPMPPLPLSYNLKRLREWGERTGIPFGPTPQAKNSRPYDGRSICKRCNTCEICPTGAKYSPDFTFRRLLEQKKIALHSDTLVRRLIVHDTTSTIVAAHAVNRNQPDPPIEYRAKLFVVAAGYAWSPHLLLLSASSRYPNGLANSSGLVGRYMTGHSFISAQIQIKTQIFPGMNEQHSLISRRFFHCQADRPFLRHDLRIWESSDGRDPRLRNEQGQPLFGDALLKDWRRRAAQGCARVRMYYDVHPSRDSRLTLDATNKNGWGDPLPKIDHRVTPETREREGRTREHIHGLFEQLARADDGKVLRTSSSDYLDHPGGGCRMGNDPATSICDSSGRTHDHPNLFVVGSPTCVTGGCTNGTLTFVALTLRAAPRLAEQLR